jgi:hypothetical protein
VCCILSPKVAKQQGAAHHGRLLTSSYGRAMVYPTIGSWFKSKVNKSKSLSQPDVKIAYSLVKKTGVLKVASQ